MPLDVSRLQLVRALRACYDAPDAVDPGALIQLAYQWFDDLKEWEEEETFERAFVDRRMTLRLLNADESRSRNDYQRDVDAFKAVAEGGTYKKSGGPTQVYLSGGMQGLKERTDPANFVRRNATRERDPAGQSEKNRLGLHDLSARLLDPRFAIGKQGYNLDKTKHAVFMPVPKQEDHVVFYGLNYLAKTDPQFRAYGPYVNAVQFIRARMTRIKLAEATDMGAGFIVMEDQGTGRTRIRYGLTGTVTVKPKAVATTLSFAEQLALKRGQLRPPEERVETNQPLTPRQVQARITTAWRYKSILQTAEQLGNNEIAIAYRTHASPLFPMVTTWPDRGLEDGFYLVTAGAAQGRVLHDDGTLFAFS